MKRQIFTASRPRLHVKSCPVRSRQSWYTEVPVIGNLHGLRHPRAHDLDASGVFIAGSLETAREAKSPSKKIPNHSDIIKRLFCEKIDVYQSQPHRLEQDLLDVLPPLTAKSILLVPSLAKIKPSMRLFGSSSTSHYNTTTSKSPQNRYPRF